MSKNTKLMRIVYYKENDEYVLETSLDNGETWGFNTGYKCLYADGQDKKTEEPMFIYCGIVGEIKKCLSLGYKMTY